MLGVSILVALLANQFLGNRIAMSRDSGKQAAIAEPTAAAAAGGGNTSARQVAAALSEIPALAAASGTGASALSKRKRYIPGENTTLSGDSTPLALGDHVMIWLERRKEHGGDDWHLADVVGLNDRGAPHGKCFLCPATIAPHLDSACLFLHQ